jgi:multidrug resistance efflux pump
MKSIHSSAARWAARLARVAVTLVMTGLALRGAWLLWDHYELEPWTRDGRVRAEVVQIAPDVSGLITSVSIRDNQRVRAGELLFEIDRARYELAVRQARAALAAQQAALAQAVRESERNARLGGLVSEETHEQASARAAQAQAALAVAGVALETAELNLARARVRAPMDSLATNLDLRQGSYATAGRPVLALVEERTLYVEGYFEETKLARIHPGDRVRVTPMDADVELSGTVESLAAGIADRDRSTAANLLPSVTPTFNWVRLAQRVPVRVKLDPLPAGSRLVVGQTVTVQVIEAGRQQGTAAAAWSLHRALQALGIGEPA